MLFGDGHIAFADTKTGQPLPMASNSILADEGVINAIAYAPNGKYFVTVGMLGNEQKCVCKWDAKRRSIIEVMKVPSLDAVAVAISSDSRVILSAGKDKRICRWDAITCKPIEGPVIGHSCTITALAYSPDNTQFASGDASGIIKRWDAATGKLINNVQAHVEPVRSLTYSPTGHETLSASKSGMSRIDTATNRLIGPLEYLEGDCITAQYANRGKEIHYIVEDEVSNQTLYRWHIPTRRSIGKVRLGPKEHWFVRGSPSGRLLMAIPQGKDYAVEFWLHNTQPVEPMEF